MSLSEGELKGEGGNGTILEQGYHVLSELRT
jgi:hypothetical protein